METKSCLENRKVVVRYIMKKDPDIQDENHVLYGGMSDDSTIEFVAPITESGFIVPTIINKEQQAFLEEVMGFSAGYMSPHSVNNFWNDHNARGLNSVVLGKSDTILDLSLPGDYIKYLILKANKNEICPSHQEYKLRPKSSYRFEIIDFEEQHKVNVDMMNIEIKAYELMGSIKSDFWKMKTILEGITKRVYASNASLDYMQSEVHKLIKKDVYVFVEKAEDKLLDNKVIINKAVEKHVVIKRNSTYYYQNLPMCEAGQESTLNVAANWLSLPKNAEIKYAIEEALQEEKVSGKKKTTVKE